MDGSQILLLVLKVVAVGVLVLLNGFFVATEFALVKVRQTQLEPLIAKGSRSAVIVRRLTQNLDAYLSAAQLGITLASLGLGWIGESVVTEIFITVFGMLNISLSL